MRLLPLHILVGVGVTECVVCLHKQKRELPCEKCGYFVTEGEGQPFRTEIYMPNFYQAVERMRENLYLQSLENRFQDDLKKLKGKL